MIHNKQMREQRTYWRKQAQRRKCGADRHAQLRGWAMTDRNSHDDSYRIPDGGAVTLPFSLVSVKYEYERHLPTIRNFTSRPCDFTGQQRRIWHGTKTGRARNPPPLATYTLVANVAPTKCFAPDDPRVAKLDEEHHRDHHADAWRARQGQSDKEEAGAGDQSCGATARDRTTSEDPLVLVTCNTTEHATSGQSGSTRRLIRNLREQQPVSILRQCPPTSTRAAVRAGRSQGWNETAFRTSTRAATAPRVDRVKMCRVPRHSTRIQAKPSWTGSLTTRTSRQEDKVQRPVDRRRQEVLMRPRTKIIGHGYKPATNMARQAVGRPHHKPPSGSPARRPLQRWPARTGMGDPATTRDPTDKENLENTTRQATATTTLPDPTNTRPGVVLEFTAFVEYLSCVNHDCREWLELISEEQAAALELDNLPDELQWALLTLPTSSTTTWTIYVRYSRE